ncbi:hypothetical protein N9L92_05145 [Saprospiraceae bacterium]|nr:hypothetical protein [Saprospiraceae bacterium]
MIVTAELSLYPLQENYEETIIHFIKALKSHDNISVHTHAMSTFVKGEHTHVMNAISKALESADESSNGFSLVTKLINRDLPVEKGFLEF